MEIDMADNLVHKHNRRLMRRDYHDVLNQSLENIYHNMKN